MLLSGVVGIILLEKNMKGFKKKVLVLSDIHAGIPYCKKQSLKITDWLKKKLYKNHILLEEVPRGQVLLHDLWIKSPHTQALKNLYLNNKKNIDAIDIRPLLFPYSCELIETDEKLGNIKLKDYIKNIRYFYKRKSKEYNQLIKPLLLKKINKNTGLNMQFKKIKKKLDYYIKKNKKFMNQKLYNIFYTDMNKLHKLNDIANLTMEWYTILNLFSTKKISIIHTGLAHSQEIIKNLINYYNFQVIFKDGQNTLPSPPNISSCIFLPENINKKIINKNSFFGIF